MDYSRYYSDLIVRIHCDNPYFIISLKPINTHKYKLLTGKKYICVNINVHVNVYICVCVDICVDTYMYLYILVIVIDVYINIKLSTRFVYPSDHHEPRTIIINQTIYKCVKRYSNLCDVWRLNSRYFKENNCFSNMNFLQWENGQIET